MVTTEGLKQALRALRGVRVLVVGDLILDRYVWGSVDRISPEAPVPVVKVGSTEDRLGGAGNAVRNLRLLGAEVDVCSAVGDDEEGSVVMRLLAQDGVGTEGVVIDRARPTSVKTRVIASRQQIVRIDREERRAVEKPQREGFAAMTDALLDRCDVLVMSDYGKGLVTRELCDKLESAADAGRLGLDVRPFVLDPHPTNYDVYRRVTVAKPNRKEAEAAVGYKISSVADAHRAGRDLAALWRAEVVMVTLGEDGMVIVQEGHDPRHLPTKALDVFDVSGAGDTVTATFAAALGGKVDVVTAGELANLAAGIAVSEVGTFAVGADLIEKALGERR